jgi:hypothetical protein
MVSRIIIQPGRIIVSKPGVTVSTGMANTDKIFDSDWNYSGILLEAGSASDPGGGDWHLMFKKNYGYAPTVITRQYESTAVTVPWGAATSIRSPMMGISSGINNYPMIYADRIVFPRNPGPGNYAYGDIEYEVYGVD